MSGIGVPKNGWHRLLQRPMVCKKCKREGKEFKVYQGRTVSKSIQIMTEHIKTEHKAIQP